MLLNLTVFFFFFVFNFFLLFFFIRAQCERKSFLFHKTKILTVSYFLLFYCGWLFFYIWNREKYIICILLAWLILRSSEYNIKKNRNRTFKKLNIFQRLSALANIWKKTKIEILKILYIFSTVYLDRLSVRNCKI